MRKALVQCNGGALRMILLEIGAAEGGERSRLQANHVNIHSTKPRCCGVSAVKLLSSSL